MSPQIIGYFSEKQDFARLGLIVGGCICTVAALCVACWIIGLQSRSVLDM